MHAAADEMARDGRSRHEPRVGAFPSERLFA